MAACPMLRAQKWLTHQCPQPPATPAQHSIAQLEELSQRQQLTQQVLYLAASCSCSDCCNDIKHAQAPCCNMRGQPHTLMASSQPHSCSLAMTRALLPGMPPPPGLSVVKSGLSAAMRNCTSSTQQDIWQSGWLRNSSAATVEATIANITGRLGDGGHGHVAHGQEAGLQGLVWGLHTRTPTRCLTHTNGCAWHAAAAT